MLAATRTPLEKFVAVDVPDSAESLGALLSELGGVSPDAILGLEVIWTPADPNDSMTEMDVMTTYPELRSRLSPRCLVAQAAPLGRLLLDVALFGLSGIVLLIVGYYLWEMITPYNLRREIHENKNTGGRASWPVPSSSGWRSSSPPRSSRFASALWRRCRGRFFRALPRGPLTRAEHDGYSQKAR